MSIREFINFKKVQHAVLYLVVIMLALNLQGSLIGRIEVFGVSPMILPALIVAIGMFENGVWGGILGIFTGIFCDIATPDHVIMHTVLFAALGFFSGMLTELIINRKFFPYFLVAAVSMLLLPLLETFRLLTGGSSGLVMPILVAILQMVLGLPFAAAIYPLCNAISARKEND